MARTVIDCERWEDQRQLSNLFRIDYGIKSGPPGVDMAIAVLALLLDEAALRHH